MIAFGVAVASQEKFERWAQPSVQRMAEPDSLLIVRSGFDSIQQPYNEILDEAASHRDLEALVLLHEDVELVDPRLCAKLRRGFAHKDVGALGAIGSRGVDGIAWWDGTTRYGRVHAPNVAIDGVCAGDVEIGWHDVEALDGLLIAVSPWIARRLRFDMRFAPTFHGYDVDFSFQVRAAGQRCVVAPIDVVHYGTWKLGERERWSTAAKLWERKWGARRARHPTVAAATP
jgi:GT2 family glycosyltransferase